MAEIRRGAADVNYDGFLDSGEVGGTAHRVGGTRCKAVDRKRRSPGSLRDGSVVLGDEQRRRQPDPFLGVLEAADGLLGQRDQRRIQDRGILPLEHADAAEKMRAGDRDAWNFFAQDRRDGFLVGGVHRRKHRGDNDVFQPPLADLTRNGTRRRHVQRHEPPSVIVMAAFDLPDSRHWQARRDRPANP